MEERIIQEVWLILNSIKDNFKKHGFILKNYKENYFQIYFIKEKLNKNSLAIKHDIDGIELNCSSFDIPIIQFCLLRNDYRVHVKEICNFLTIINQVFITTNFLKEMFIITGTKFYKEKENIETNYFINKTNVDYIIDNLKQFKNYKDYKKKLKRLNSYKTILKNNEIIIHKANSCVNNINSFHKIDINHNFKLVKQSNKLNNILHERFIIEIIKFEKILFPEIFNFSLKKIIINEKINMFINKYKQISIKIGKIFNNFNNFRLLEHKLSYYN